MATLIKPDGTSVVVEPKNGTNFSLEELYEHLDCSMIQVNESVKDGTILIFDEEFLMRGDIVRDFRHGMAIESRDSNGRTVYKPWLNRLATHLMHPRLGPFTHNVICGNAIHCKDSELK